MSLPQPTRSVYNGVLKFQGADVPLRIYNGFEEFGVPGHLYHSDCGGKVRSPFTCEEHPGSDVGGETYSAITVYDTKDNPHLVPIDSETRNIILDRESPLKVVAEIPQRSLGALMSDGALTIGDFLLVGPQKNNADVRWSPVDMSLLPVLLERLKVRRTALLCVGSLGAMKRYMILLSNGTGYELIYEEEKRGQFDLTPQTTRGTHRALSGAMNNLLDDLPSDFPTKLSLADIEKRVADWLSDTRERLSRPTRRSRKKVGV